MAAIHAASLLASDVIPSVVGLSTPQTENTSTPQKVPKIVRRTFSEPYKEGVNLKRTHSIARSDQTTVERVEPNNKEFFDTMLSGMMGNFIANAFDFREYELYNMSKQPESEIFINEEKEEKQKDSTKPVNNFDITFKLKGIPEDETRRNAHQTYNDYKLATYLLFSLHDKPNPFFIEKFKTNLLPLMDSDHAKRFKKIFSKIGDASKNNKTISQTYIHKLLEDLHAEIKSIMKDVYGIDVPETQEYILGKKDNKNENNDNVLPLETSQIGIALGKVLEKCPYVMVDAVSAEKYVRPYDKTLIKPNGLPDQDGAITTSVYSHKQQMLTEDFDNTSFDNTSVTSKYVLEGTPEGIQPVIVKDVDPLMQIKDVVVVCQKITNQNYYLYYSRKLFDNAEENTIIENIPQPGSIPMDVHISITHNNITKYLFGFVTGRLSQNQSLLFLNFEDKRKASSTIRGTGNDNLPEGTWCYDSTRTRVAMSCFSKEVGDQSKIKYMEFMNRNFDKTALYTVDGFIKDSAETGVVIFKSPAYVRSYEKQGFRELSHGMKRTLEQFYVWLQDNVETYDLEYYEEKKKLTLYKRLEHYCKVSRQEIAVIIDNIENSTYIGENKKIYLKRFYIHLMSMYHADNIYKPTNALESESPLKFKSKIYNTRTLFFEMFDFTPLLNRLEEIEKHNDYVYKSIKNSQTKSSI